MVDHFNSLSEAAPNVNTIVDFLSGTSSDSEQIISELGTIIKELENLEAILENQVTYSRFCDQLSILKSYAQEANAMRVILGTVAFTTDPAYPSHIMVNTTASGPLVDFEEWTTGEGGIMPRIAALLNAPISGSNLYTIFVTQGFLDNYETVWSAWQTGSVAENSIYSGVSLYDGAFNLMEKTFKVVGTFAFVFEVARLINIANNKNSAASQYSSIGDTLKRWWGSTNDTSAQNRETVWGVFGQFMSEVINTPALPVNPNPPAGTPVFNTISPMGSVMRSAYNQDNWLGHDMVERVDSIGEHNNNKGFIVVPFQCNEPNSFISAFRMTSVSSLTNPDGESNEFFLLQCQVATFDEYLNLKTDGVWYPQETAIEVILAANNNGQIGWLDCVSVLYVNAPKPLNNNTLKVIYGFQIGPSDGAGSNRLGIQLQYADVDLTKRGEVPLSFNDKTYYTAPFYNDDTTDANNHAYKDYTFASYTNYFDLRPSGNSTISNGEPVTVPVIATNATFLLGDNLILPAGEEDNLKFTNRLYIQTQAASALYMADFFQPCNLVPKSNG